MMRLGKMAMVAGLALATAMAASAQLPSQVTADFLKNAKPLHRDHHQNKGLKASGPPESSSVVPGVDSIVNFGTSFNAPGIGPDGSAQNTWFYAMVGNPPETGGVTFIDAPIIPVSLNLLAEDGSVKFRYDVTPFVDPTLLSPIFLPTKFTSSPVPTQFADAVARAEFFHVMRDDWHTLLVPELQRHATMNVPSGKYVPSLNADGSCCQFVLVDFDIFTSLLFPPTFPVDNTTLVGAAELSGVMTTKEITTFLFPNTFLFENGNINECCVLGFHGPDEEPGTAANGNELRLYMAIFASYISPGLFPQDVQDVAGLSHEMAETFNDPFVGFDGVHNITPWWLSGSQCQDLLEVGDVVESLPADVTFDVKNIFGTTYHVQNVALLQWFEFQQHSDAFQAAYSYPNRNTLKSLSPFEQPGCK